MAPRLPLAAALVLAAAGPAWAEKPADPDVDKAVKRGQAYLKAVYRAGGPAAGIVGPGGIAVPPDIFGGLPGPFGTGPMWIAGLALVESGVPANDPVVAALAKAGREAAMSTTSTYSLSLLIMFLDRVGHPADEPLIQFLTLRLMSGQLGDGSWSYMCDGLTLDPVQSQALYAALYRGATLTTPDSPKQPPKKKEARPREDLDDGPKPPAKKDAPAPVTPPPPKVEEKPKGLHPALADLDRQVRNRAGGGFGAGAFGGGDHSNTQFATVALWCGRRHHVDVADALAALDKHYRGGRGADGGWSYTAGAGLGSSPAMTCAGLMGLAMGFASKELKDGSDKSARIDADAVSQDPVVQGGLKYVGDFLAAAQAAGAAPLDPRNPPQFVPGGPDNDLANNLYFMWSLERVGMVYGLQTIGKVDWYDWGSKILVRSQNRDGSWPTDGFHSGNSDVSTAFALLFLCKANLAEDARMKGKVKDPGTSRLHSPGDLKAMLDKVPRPKAEPGTTPATGTPGTKNPGTTAQPPASAQAKALADALLAATGAQRDDLLAKYRDAKGSEYLDALLLALGKLPGEARAPVREALVGRLTRMTAHTLNTFMADPDPELRRAAALAAAAKGKDRLAEFADTLVRLTADSDDLVAQAARTSLKTLTGQDFGPESAAGPEDRARAAAAWKEWWARKKPQ